MSTALGIAFLLVYVLGAVAYGSALLLSLRQASPVWSPHRRHDTPARRLDRGSLAMFLWSAIWFVVLALDQFDEFVSGPRRNVLDLLHLLLVFGFPPLIVHTMYLEGRVEEWTGRARTWATGVLVGDVHRGAAVAHRRHGDRARRRAGGAPRGLDWRAAVGSVHRRRGLRGAGDEPQPARRPDRRSTARCGGC